MVREYKGSHSGEHGDGLVRSEFHEPMFGSRLVRAFEEVKERFDPDGLLQSRQDRARAEVRRPLAVPLRARTIAASRSRPQLDWSAYPGAGGGFQGAVEMCNNNGACRKLAGGVMCPSYRVTRDERDVTRGRANTLRLAISGQLGPDALASDEMAETMKLCVSCKACRRECPTGVDMARMKIEVLAARAAKHGLSLHDRLVGYLPRYAPLAARLRRAVQFARRNSAAARAVGSFRGLSAPGAACRNGAATFIGTVPIGNIRRRSPNRRAREVVLFADTFNRYFERENLDAAMAVLIGRRLSRACGAAERRQHAAAVLRPHLPLRRQGR